MEKLKIEITTKSNCLIGNQTESFSVGGVDQGTTIDENGYPMIPGSAIKGVLRTIVRENNKELKNIKKYYNKVFKEIDSDYDDNINFFKESGKEKQAKIVKKLKEDLKFYWLKDEDKVRAEYIFGVEGINELPKLYFSDFRVIKDENKKIKENYFLIDSKTSISEENGDLISNPRTYKVVKPEVKFEGEIYFKGFKREGIEEIKEEIISMLNKFNENIYFIGNSKSRGYGRIFVDINIKEAK